MGSVRVDQKLIVPLFNVEFDDVLRIPLANGEFVDAMTLFILPEPVQVMPSCSGLKTEKGNEPIPVSIPAPRTTIYLFPWGSDLCNRREIESLVPLEQLPMDFDCFDNLGPFAFRPGPGGLGGFQTVTTAHTGLRAKSLLVIQFDQVYPESIRMMIGCGNPYEFALTESLLDGLRLLSAGEPHHCKGFHIVGDRFVDSIIKWPLTEIQGSSVRLGKTDIEDLKLMCLAVWRIRRDARRDPKKNRSCAILSIAIDYYYLSATMTEPCTVFLLLMIAFEALFKEHDEKSASAASSRLAKLIAKTKSECNHIRRFMWDPRGDTGCCQVRNKIVHGGMGGPSSSTYWQLRRYIRGAIVRIIHLVLSSEIDREHYYASMDEYVIKNHTSLPNS